MRLLKFLLLCVLIAAALIGYYVYLPYGPSSETFVDIAPGTGTPAIAAQLQQAGILRSRYALDALKEAHGGVLKAGVYRFDHPITAIEVFLRLRRGDVYTKTVVVPEGFDLFDIAAAIEAAGLAPRSAVMAAARRDAPLVSQWAPGAASVEGFLFPDTYKFSPHATPDQMLTAMVKRFGQMATKLGLSGQDTARVVTLASLIEKEVHVDSERGLVAGVFTNRLANQMPLQTDPAVVYASKLRGTWTGVIHQSELHSDSAYNTYAHAGLPPGPICNPGVASLRAALHPSKTSFLYFVANSDGTTQFSTSLTEHAQQVAAYRAKP